ncbi:uncharacterized protein LOC143181670 [Calliopsis andreniformis]|uniref:uncharacterized protein LOC143181670 n=1 Tax=Calliopsis andreniformis TaxID=337506 RepID=UPI003FCDBE86
MLRPMTKPSWHYVSASALAISGIYSQKDLENLRDHIMFPAEKTAILNTLARGVTGRNIPPGSVSLIGIFDEDTITKLAESAVTRFWNGFVAFGSLAAGILGIFRIIKFIKTIIDTIIHCCHLHSVYGCRPPLLGAMWSSLTHLLIRLAEKKQSTTQPNQPPPAAVAEPQATPSTVAKEFKQAVRDLEQISFRNLN